MVSVDLSALGHQPEDMLLPEVATQTKWAPGTGKGPEGVVVFENLSRRRYRLRVWAPGYRLRPDLFLDAESSSVDIELERSGDILGRVVAAETGAGLKQVKLQAVGGIRSGRKGSAVVHEGEMMERLHRIAAAPGVFLVSGIQNPTVRVDVQAPGRASGSVLVEGMDSDERREIEIAVPIESVLAGQVLGFGGAAAGKAVIRATRIDDGNEVGEAAEGALIDGNPGGFEPDPRKPSFLPASDFEVEADDEGRFRIEGLAAGRYRLEASHPRHLDAEAVEIALGAAASVDDVELYLQPAGGIRGLVLDVDGRPQPGASISLRNPAPADAGGGLDSFILSEEILGLHADGEGRFLIEGIKPGSYTLLVAEPEIGLGEGVVPAGAQVDVRVRAGRDAELQVRLLPGN